MVEIAVSAYDDDTYGSPRDGEAFRAGIQAQVAVVEDWWAAGDTAEDGRRFEVVRPEKLRTVSDLRAFLDEEDLAEAEDDEVLVIYVTGHGVSCDSEVHFLLLPDSDPDRVLATAFQTADLVTTVLDSHAGHVLVMVDSCFSGVLRRDLVRRLAALAEQRRGLNSLVVLTSADEFTSPRLEEFSRLLGMMADHFRKESTGHALPYLSYQDFFSAMTSFYEPSFTANVRRVWPEESLQRDKDHQEPSPCLPNPGYVRQPMLVEQARSAVAWSPAELDAYWLSRAAGRPSLPLPGATGWYFTERVPQMRRLIAFLTEEEGTLVVTGEAGSGKSALLARAVTLSDPRFRADPAYRDVVEATPTDLLVPVGAVDAAVLARNADADELAAALHTALIGRGPEQGPGVRTVDLILDHALGFFRSEDRPLTVVIDGVDEARNPTRIITDVIRPLVEQWSDDGRPVVRMVVGIRSAHAETTGRLRPSQDRTSDLLNLLVRATDCGEPLRTDAAGAEDIAEYTGSLLRTLFGMHDDATDSDAQLLDGLAAVVAAEVAPSFLDARLAAEALHQSGRLPSPDDARWLATLRHGTQTLLLQDIDEVARNSGLPAESVVHVLRATALAQGSGMPWAEVWPTAVTALATEGLPVPAESLIRQIRESRLAGYLMTAVEDGRFVYRPIHERVGELLRKDPQHLLAESSASDRLPGGGDTAGDHRRLALAFSALQRAKDGHPHPYLCHHLVRHAAAGGVLNDEVLTEKFLPYETSGNVRGALGLLTENSPGTEGLFAWTRIEPFLDDAPPRSRAESLRFSLWEQELEEREGRQWEGQRPEAGGASAELQGRLTPLWKDLAVRGNVLARQERPVSALVSFGIRDGTRLVAVGCDDGTVQVVDPATAAPLGPAVKGLGAAVTSLAAIPGPDGERWVAVGTDSGAWACDPLSGVLAPLPVAERVHCMASYRDEEGRAVVAFGTSTGLVLCDVPRALRASDDMLRYLQVGPVTALAVLEQRGGRTLLAVQNADYADVVDGRTLEQVCTVPVPGHDVAALSLIEVQDGGVLLAVAFKEERGDGVLFWNAASGEPSPHRTIRRTASVLTACRSRDGRTLLALGGEDGSVQLWEPEAGEEYCRFPTDHTGGVLGLTVVPGPEEVQVLVSGSSDRTVRVWNPEVWRRRPSRRAQPAVGEGLFAVSPPGTNGPPVLVFAGPEGNLILRSADNGGLLAMVPYPRRLFTEGGLTALTTYRGADRSTAVVAGLPDGSVCRWDGSWRTMNMPTSTEDPPTAFAVLRDEGRLVLAVGTRSGSLGYCDLDTGTVLGWRKSAMAGGPVRAMVRVPLRAGDALAVAAGQEVQLCHPLGPVYDTWPSPMGPVESLAVCPGEEAATWRLVAGGSDGRIHTWTPEAGHATAFTFPAGHNGPVSALGIVRVPGSRPLVASAGLNDTTLRLWDAGTGEEALRLVTGARLTSLGMLAADEQAGRPGVVFGGPAGVAAVGLRAAEGVAGS